MNIFYLFREAKKIFRVLKQKAQKLRQFSSSTPNPNEVDLSDLVHISQKVFELIY